MTFKIVQLEQGTDAWHDWRRNGIGCSDAHVLMGRRNNRGRSKLFQEKLNGSSGGAYRSEAMALGHKLEVEARADFEKTSGRSYRPSCLEHKKYPWLRASVDGLSVDRTRVVEIKCGKRIYETVSSSHSVPRQYRWQMHHILAVTGFSEIDFLCYWPGERPLHYVVKRDPTKIQDLVNAEYEFWKRVVAARST